MKGFTAFARKEVVEILRTWRIWVLPGMLLFFAVSGPVMAKFTPQIVGSLAGDQLGGLKLPDPVYFDSYAQWIKNLSQIVIFAIVIIYGGIVSSETKSGTAILVLTKPVSRAAFVLAKALVHSLFLVVAVLVGTVITWGGTAVMFGTARPGPLFAAAGAWLVFGVLFIAVMTLLSVNFGSQAGAAGVGLGVFVVMSIGTLWQTATERTPLALLGQPALLAAGKTAQVAWPIATSLVLTVLLVAVAAWSFARKEL